MRLFPAAFLFSLASTICVAEPGSDLTNVAERPPAESFSETTYDLEIDDPYRWMEREDRQVDVADWIKKASAHFTSELERAPGRRRIADRLDALSRASVSYSSVKKAGEYTFFLRLDSRANLPVLIVTDTKGGERVLFDPAATAGESDAPVAINNYAPSPSGDRLAFHTAEGGGEVGVMRFMDVASGAILEDRLGPIWGEFPVEWLDEQTVLYTRMTTDPASDKLQNMKLKLHKMGEPAESDITIMSAAGPQPFEIQPQEFPHAFASANGKWIIGSAAGARADFRMFAIESDALLSGETSWVEIGDYDDRINDGGDIGDTMYLLTTRNESNGEVIRVDLNAPDLNDAEIVLPAGDMVLNGLNATKDGLYITAIEDGVNRLLYLKKARGKPRIVKAPFDGSINDVVVSADKTSLTFSIQSWLQNEQYFEARRGKAKPLGLAADTDSGVSAFEVMSKTATSRDGANVPLTIITPRKRAGEAGAPVYLYAYGSYGFSMLPVYSPNFLAWLEEGGVIAVCHVRGGGERGRAWHEAGRGANKPNGHADLIACGEQLIELGVTSPELLGVTGVSAAGLLVPPAALQRPDLFAAVVLRVGVLNATRLAVAENGPNQFAEMGDPTTADGFHALYQQDSYHWLNRVEESPDWLLTVGLNDHRVEPWMSAKFGARALSRFGDRNIIAIRTDPDAGHGVGSTRKQRVEERADVYTFLLNRFGVEDFQLKPAD